jgi:hypothetical protein
MFSSGKNRLGTREGALIANEAYEAHANKTLEGGRTLIDESEFAKAYRTPDGRIQVGIRGTASIGDAFTDIKHLTGSDIRQTDRYKSTEKFITDYVQSPLSAHSLTNFLKAGGIVSGQMKMQDIYGNGLL